MKISKAIETPNGEIKFEGELSQDEVDLILGVGLNFLFQQGAIPFRVSRASDIASNVEGTDTEQ